MATIGSETEQVVADPTNTVVYGGETFVKFTASTYDVELQNGNNLVIDTEKIINEVEDGVPTSIQGGYYVIDPEPPIEWTPEQNTYWIKDPVEDPTLGDILQLYTDNQGTTPLVINDTYVWYDFTKANTYQKFRLGEDKDHTTETDIYNPGNNKVWYLYELPAYLCTLNGETFEHYQLDGNDVIIDVMMSDG